ncbi:hypothetical protein HMN09_00365900 [Mycena chlorophos]|uniref:C2H2-type domain-containing protein n=1 Tax=Mycena chlorophos TaxID=658473 RepID=A0A8H6WIV7_MYCCL|nr:hypothetical protein HMN09_00365900 [Mycena chlorophos]
MATSTQALVLPSIHEMFPEHLLHPPLPFGASRHPHRLPKPYERPRLKLAPPPMVLPPVPSPPVYSTSYSFDPETASPSASTRPPFRSPPSRWASPPPSEGSDEHRDESHFSEEGDDAVPAGWKGRKHVCPTCQKRFNRPSSLRIHVNTHTGATREHPP